VRASWPLSPHAEPGRIIAERAQAVNARSASRIDLNDLVSVATVRFGGIIQASNRSSTAAAGGRKTSSKDGKVKRSRQRYLL
jgi:hypothetical protein